MDRALQDVNVVAAEVNNKGSGYERLDNYQLAAEVQKFNGYNHFSRSSANLLEEVVRRLLITPPPTRQQVMRSNHRRNSCVSISVRELDAIKCDAVSFVLGTKGFTELQFWNALRDLIQQRDPMTWRQQLCAVLPQHFLNLLMDDFPLNLMPQILQTQAVVKFYFTASAPTPSFVKYNIYVEWTGLPAPYHLSRGMSRFSDGFDDEAAPENIPAMTGSIYTEADLASAKVKVVMDTRGKYRNRFQEQFMRKLEEAGFGNPRGFYEKLLNKYNVSNWYKDGTRETNNVAIYLLLNDDIFWRWEPIDQENQ